MDIPFPSVLTRLLKLRTNIEPTTHPFPLIETPLVDAHAHVYRLDMPMQESAWHRPAEDATIEDYLATLDRAGVHFGILAAASMYGDYNDYMLEAVKAHKRLRATAIVSPDIDPYALRRMDAAGIVGIRLQFRNVQSPPDLSSFPYQRLFRRIADLGWHVHLHDEGERLPLYIKDLVEAGPRLVIDHFGRPAGPDGLETESFRAVLEAIAGGNTWVKLSGGFRLKGQNFVKSAADTLLANAGPERLLWGSDWPFAAYENAMSYDDAVAQYKMAVPDLHVRRAIDQTALRFYFS